MAKFTQLLLFYTSSALYMRSVELDALASVPTFPTNSTNATDEVELFTNLTASLAAQLVMDENRIIKNVGIQFRDEPKPKQQPPFDGPVGPPLRGPTIGFTTALPRGTTFADIEPTPTVQCTRRLVQDLNDEEYSNTIIVAFDTDKVLPFPASIFDHSLPFVYRACEIWRPFLLRHLQNLHCPANNNCEVNLFLITQFSIIERDSLQFAVLVETKRYNMDDLIMVSAETVNALVQTDPIWGDILNYGLYDSTTAASPSETSPTTRQQHTDTTDVSQYNDIVGEYTDVEYELEELDITGRQQSDTGLQQDTFAPESDSTTTTPATTFDPSTIREPIDLAGRQHPKYRAFAREIVISACAALGFIALMSAVIIIVVARYKWTRTRTWSLNQEIESKWTPKNASTSRTQLMVPKHAHQRYSMVTNNTAHSTLSSNTSTLDYGGPAPYYP